MTGEMKRTPIPEDAVIYWRLPFDAIPDHELGHQTFRYMRPETRPKTPPLSWRQRVWSRLTSPRHRLPYR